MFVVETEICTRSQALKFYDYYIEGRLFSPQCPSTLRSIWEETLNMFA